MSTQNEHPPGNSVSQRPPTLLALLACVLAIAVMAWLRLGVFTDRLIPIGYGVPLCLFLWARDRRLMWIAVAVFAMVSYCEIFITLPLHDPATRWKTHLWEAYELDVFDLFVIATVVHVLIGARQRLERLNEELFASNTELTAREEEIQRQNEELQSSTEELERQSEELRVANDDLAHRERMLETLLELSRSLHVGVDHNQTLTRICETLGHLIDGSGVATAILIDTPRGMEVRCHYGFGPAGIKQELFARNQSFAALVIDQRRTGYLEDLALRPDLHVPQPVAGQPMLSALAAALTVNDKVIGTIELYGHERRHWSEEQISLIESLAAQTSISLENAQLFEEVDQGRRRLATILEQVPVGLSIANADASDIRLNAVAAAMLGEPPDTNIAGGFNRPSWNVMADGKPVPFEQFPIVRAIRGERVYPHEIELALPTGRRLTVLNSAAPFYDSDDELIGAVSTFVDITQLKQLQRELESRRREAEEASVRKTRFLAAASHDIRTPANAISLLAELLKRTTDNPAMAGEIPQLADELRNSATSLVNLVSNILDVTRFDTDKIDLHETEFPLAALLEEEVRQVLPLAQAKNLDLDCDSAAGDVWLRADRIKLGRVLGNLLGNAIKFTDRGGVRCTSGRREDGSIFISVSDTGIGVSPENQTRIFDEFWQLSDPNRSKGSGLGLAISKRLIEAMGGDIKVQSVASQGSTFTVLLPRNGVISRTGSDGSRA